MAVSRGTAALYQWQLGELGLPAWILLAHTAVYITNKPLLFADFPLIPLDVIWVRIQPPLGSWELANLDF